MPWARLHDQANGSGKLLALSNGAYRLWGAGLIYCQANLTDGFIPEHVPATLGVRVKSTRELSLFVDELCRSLLPGKGPLWHRAPGGFQIHDYFDWNDSRESILADRARTKDRVKRFRDRMAADRVTNGVQNADVTPLQPRFETEETESYERRLKSGSTSTEDQNQEDQRRSRGALRSQPPDDAPRVLQRLAHDVLDDIENGQLNGLDAPEELKTRAAKANLLYDSDRIRKALDCADAQRARRRGAQPAEATA